jgi:hypothetical protein
MNSDQHQSPENWESALGRALKNLPERGTPSTLLPRVMAQANARGSGKWHQRLWHRWTFWAFAATGALLLALAARIAWLGGRFYETNVNPALDHCVGICRTVFSAVIGSLLGSTFGVGPEAYHFNLLAVCLLLLAMYITCIAVGSFIYQVVRR